VFVFGGIMMFHVKKVLFSAVVFGLLLAFPTQSLFAQTTYSADFESPTFVLGNVQGQNGWGYLSNSPAKGIIEAAPAGSPASFGAQSLAIRTNDVGNFGVQNQLFSALVAPAGETGSTIGGVLVPAPFNQYIATFYYQAPATPVISTRPDGRFAELNPSSKNTPPTEPANRYAQIRVINNTNTAAGLVNIEMAWTVSGTTFTTATVAQNLNWGQWYVFDYRISLCDGLNGVGPNDTFRIVVQDLSGTNLGIVFGSTWETGYKTGAFGGGTTPRAINGFDLWTQTGPNDALVGYIDNFSQSVTNIPDPCSVPTAASVFVAGRVMSGPERPASKAIVTMTDSSGVMRTAVTNPFGYYRFDQVTVGQSVVVQASAKGRQYAPQAVNVMTDVENLNFGPQ
jgi:hypothetical protein